MAFKSPVVRLMDLAKVVRSKNAGPFELTFDIIFDHLETYRHILDSGVLTRKLICELYQIEDEDLLYFGPVDPALAIKITIVRPVDSGSIGETDTYGGQQHAPLLDILVPAP